MHFKLTENFLLLYCKHINFGLFALYDKLFYTMEMFNCGLVLGYVNACIPEQCTVCCFAPLLLQALPHHSHIMLPLLTDGYATMIKAYAHCPYINSMLYGAA